MEARAHVSCAKCRHERAALPWAHGLCCVPPHALCCVPPCSSLLLLHAASCLPHEPCRALPLPLSARLCALACPAPLPLGLCVVPLLLPFCLLLCFLACSVAMRRDVQSRGKMRREAARCMQHAAITRSCHRAEARTLVAVGLDARSRASHVRSRASDVR